MADSKRNIFEQLKKLSIPLVRGSTSAKVFFLLLSIFLWFLIKLSKEGFVSQVNFPVTYAEVPADMRLLSDPPDKLRVTLRGKGFAILKLKLRSIKPLNLRIHDLPVSDTNIYRWNTNDREEIIAEELGEDVQILNIRPEQILFNFSPVESRNFKVYLRGKRDFSNFKTFYQQPDLIPDSISARGTKEELDQVDSIFTETITFTAEKDSLTRSVPLELPDVAGLEFSHEEVQVRLRYTSLTEGTVQVPLKVRNLPDNYNITLVPKRINLTFRVPIQDFSKVDAEDFELYVDYKEIEDSDRELMSVNVSLEPDFVRKVKLNPKKVEYILTKK